MRDRQTDRQTDRDRDAGGRRRLQVDGHPPPPQIFLGERNCLMKIKAKGYNQEGHEILHTVTVCHHTLHLLFRLVALQKELGML